MTRFEWGLAIFTVGALVAAIVLRDDGVQARRLEIEQVSTLNLVIAEQAGQLARQQDSLRALKGRVRVFYVCPPTKHTK